MTATVSWQAPLPTNVGHAYLTLHPGTPPVCGQPVTAVREQFAYSVNSKCTRCLAYEAASVSRRVARTHV